MRRTVKSVQDPMLGAIYLALWMSGWLISCVIFLIIQPTVGADNDLLTMILLNGAWLPALMFVGLAFASPKKALRKAMALTIGMMSLGILYGVWLAWQLSGNPWHYLAGILPLMLPLLLMIYVWDFDRLNPLPDSKPQPEGE